MHLRFRHGARESALILGTLLALAGCADGPGSSEAQTPPPRMPVRGGELHLMLESPGTLDPPRVDDVYESCISNQIFDGLLDLDADLHPVPCIAKEWTVSRDGREFVFSLRDDVRFHNGRTVTAQDFVYSFSRIVDPKLADHGISGEFLRKIEGVDAFSKGQAKEISGIRVLDDRRLAITLTTPYASFLSILAMDQTKVVPREEVERLGADFARFPVGTGPFRLLGGAGLRADTLVVLEANADYFRGRPHLDRVVFHVTTDYNTDRTADELLSGKLTFSIVPTDKLQRVTTDMRFRTVRRTELSFAFLGLNLQRPPFDDPLVRRAFAHAVDLQRIVEVDPTGRAVAPGILPPGMFGYSPEHKALAFDLNESRRLLAQAGHPGGRGLSKIVYWQTSRGELGKRADAVMKENFAAAGFPVEFRYVTWDEFDTKLMAHEMQSFGLSWIADLPDPDSILASLFASRGTFNFFEFSNSTVDSLLQAGTALRASNDRADLYRRAEKLILQDVAVVPLYHITNNYAVRRDVENLVVTPFGIANLQLETVWLDPAGAAPEIP